MNLKDLGKKETPEGINIQGEDEFLKLRNEIEKRKNIDWVLVSKEAANILHNLSKDLFSACYLGVAQLHLNDLKGFETGLEIIYDLITVHWDNIYPPPERVKARRNAVDFFVKKSAIAFNHKNYQKIDKSIIEKIKTQLQQLEDALKKVPNLLPPFEKLYEAINRIPVVENKSQKIKQRESQSKTDDKGEEINTYEELINFTHKKMTAFLPKIREDDKTLNIPHIYRLNRYFLWLRIHNAPPCISGTKTDLPKPIVNIQEIYKTERWISIIRTSEGLLQSSPFWLDLNYYTAEALKKLGNDYHDALQAVEEETVSFVKRIPEIVNLEFNTGTGFANELTKEWLQSLQQQPITGSISKTESGAIEKEINQVIQNQPFIEAVMSIQNMISSCKSKSDQFECRWALAKLLFKNHKTQNALPHIEMLLEDIELFRLFEWSPGKVLDVLSRSWQIFNQQSQNKEQSKNISPEKIEYLFKRISQIDPLMAINLFEKK